jgi:hypothetical protein
MNLQHAQHDAHFGLHSSNGRISQALTHVFDLQNVCLLGLLVPNSCQLNKQLACQQIRQLSELAQIQESERVCGVWHLFKRREWAIL